MTVSVFDLFSIGIGPSSSHTVGPMRAARQFIINLQKKENLSIVASIKTELFGSLGLTGRGHCTDIAVLLGLEGETPEGIDPEKVACRVAHIRSSNTLNLLGAHPVAFNEKKELLFFKGKRLPYHSNAMRFTAYDKNFKELFYQVFYSLGGGFIIDHDSTVNGLSAELTATEIRQVPRPFKSGAQLLQLCHSHGVSIRDLMWENERTWRSDQEIRQRLLAIWNAMQACVQRGCAVEGILPGGLNVKRRAPQLYRELAMHDKESLRDPVELMDWVSLFALAVNEENAAGGRVVTAPTNGAAGIIPAVLHYFQKFSGKYSEEGVMTFLLTAGAIGILFKEGASLSAAEVGCQGEVGVACSMAAAGLAAALGASNEQIENAAEIGMEHNLGLTCDPVGGLVQIPCIERNTMGAVKAINAARLAMRGDGTHIVHLDSVIATMRQTGADMRSIYKETSKGGLAVNVPAC